VAGLGIRPLAPADLLALKALIDAVGLFPSALLDGMVAGHLNGEAPDHLWFVAEHGGPVAVAYVVPEPLTEGTWNCC
jgi:hypothetical protein